jgi:geranylgeranyl transferase type-1 subunit beta
MLGSFEFVDKELIRSFILQCEYKYGGFGKVHFLILHVITFFLQPSQYPGQPPDVLHSYYGLCGLSLIGQDALPQLYCPLGTTLRTAKRVSEELP